MELPWDLLYLTPRKNFKKNFFAYCHYNITMPSHCVWLWFHIGSIHMAIPAFGFEGHILSRGLSGAGARSIARLARPCVDRSFTHVHVYSRAHDDFFSCFKASIQRSDEDWRLLAFLSSSITLTDKNCSQNKKKGLASALPASVAGSSYLSSSKVKNKDHWTTNVIDRTVSVEQTERPSSRKA